MAKSKINQQVCKTCKSRYVYRPAWVNVNTDKVNHQIYSDFQLEWCLKCNSETTIIEMEEKL